VRREVLCCVTDKKLQGEGDRHRALSSSNLHARHHSHLAGATRDAAEPRVVAAGRVVEEAGLLEFRSPTRLVEFHPLLEEIPGQRERGKTIAHSSKGENLEGGK